MMAEKVVFLDRDNTLIEDPGYINDPSQVKLLPGVGKALNQLNSMGYKLIVVSNQSGVARGIITETALKKIHQKLRDLLSHDNVLLDEIYCCPYHPEGVVPKYTKESDLRKPKPGMLLQAAEEMEIDFERSWMIGDAYCDVAAGAQAGCKTILINPSLKPAVKQKGDTEPDKKAINLKEAVNIIKMLDRQAEAPVQVESEPVMTEQVEQPVEQVVEPKAQEIVETPVPVKATKTSHPKPVHFEKMHGMLEDVLKHLKKAERNEMFEEFSWFKMLSMATQIMAAFCLLLSLWFLMDDAKGSGSVHTAIGYAIAFQLMAITFYIMRDRK